MRSSTIKWALMAGAPILFLGLLAIAGRTQVSTHEFAEYSDEATVALQAYRPVLQASLKAISTSTGPDVVRALDMWMEGHRAGLFQDVLPAGVDDQGATGVRNEISNIRQDLISRAMGMASRARLAGETDKAVRLMAKTVLVGDAGKYGGAATINVASIGQNSGLRNLIRWAPDASPAVRKEVAQILSEVRAPKRPFEELAVTVRSLEIQDRTRMEASITSFREYEPYSLLAAVEYGDGFEKDLVNTRLARTQLSPEVTGAIISAVMTEGVFQAKLAEAKSVYGAVRKDVTLASQAGPGSSKVGQNQGVEKGENG